MNRTFTKPPAPNPIDYYSAMCTSTNGGLTGAVDQGHGRSEHPHLRPHAAGKRYACRMQAYNMIGIGVWSAATAPFTAP